MQSLLSAALAFIDRWLEGRKTYAAAIGLLALAVYHFTQSQYDKAAETLLAALAAFGLRQAIYRKPIAILDNGNGEGVEVHAHKE